VNQFGKIDAAALCPAALCAGGDYQVVVEERLNLQVLQRDLGIAGHADDRYVYASFVQLGQLERWSGDMLDVDDRPRVELAEALEDGRQDAGSNGFRAAHPHLARRRVGEPFDLPQSLLELIERRPAAAQKRLAVGGELDALRLTVEEPHSQRVLERGDYFRNGRLGDAEIRCRLRHASRFHDRHEDAQVAQTQAPPNKAVQVFEKCHKPRPIYTSRNWKFLLSPEARNLRCVYNPRR